MRFAICNNLLHLVLDVTNCGDEKGFATRVASHFGGLALLVESVIYDSQKCAYPYIKLTHAYRAMTLEGIYIYIYTYVHIYIYIYKYINSPTRLLCAKFFRF